MSLSSDTQRVQQGVKDTLKTLIQKLGGTVGSELVDGYPALANAISDKPVSYTHLDVYKRQV